MAKPLSNSNISLGIPNSMQKKYEAYEKDAETVTPQQNPNNFTLHDLVAFVGLGDKTTGKALGKSDKVEAPQNEFFVLHVKFTQKALVAVNSDSSKLRLAYFDGSKWVPYTPSSKDSNGWQVKLSAFGDPPVWWGS